MTSPKTDAETKQRFMRFGLDQAKKGGTDFKLGSVKHASDMLNSLSGASMPKGAQKAAMAMVENKPGDTQAMNNVDTFASQADVKKMPTLREAKQPSCSPKAAVMLRLNKALRSLRPTLNFRVSVCPE